MTLYPWPSAVAVVLPRPGSTRWPSSRYAISQMFHTHATTKETALMISVRHQLRLNQSTHSRTTSLHGAIPVHDSANSAISYPPVRFVTRRVHPERPPPGPDRGAPMGTGRAPRWLRRHARRPGRRQPSAARLRVCPLSPTPTEIPL